MLKSLAASGMSLAILTEKIVSEGVRTGRLKQVLPDWQMTPSPIYAITETGLLPAKTQLFIEFLRVHLDLIM